MYKNAAKKKFRYQTPQGQITTEDLFDLSLEQLNSLAKSLNKQVKEHGEEDYLKVTKPEATLVKKKFDVVLDALKTKQKDVENAANRTINAAKKQKLLDALEAKRDQGLGEMSEEELLKQIEALG